ncbi:hypothetical protein N7450_005449 [Penicillium hetheringtonii]|uniref:YCII-related domain-containing protein n=1 Tax=Penicillium hetheringtonii TaxID=911720 RepID=A0AAD6DJ27_9EURO|nr:hypothetical protein N7450_005449 [Penicillium hetheringtonii]
MTMERQTKGNFLVIIPDKKDMLEMRMQVRSQHKEGIKPLLEAGILSLGGPTLVSHRFEGEEQKINGSVIMFNEQSEDEVLKIVERDVYAKSGVWDLEKMQILALGF